MPQNEADIGAEMHGWARDLFPICRSLTGPGVRETLAYIKKILPDLQIQSAPTGTKAFDWTVPDEWTIRDAYISDEAGNRVVDFRNSNLHVLGYSEPVDRVLDLAELQEHLYSLPEQPDAIPYITSYYKRRWGFCLSDNQRKALKPGRYRAVIDSDLKPGVMNYAELLLPGDSEKEVLLSTYVCHPSMANNELSGPVVVTALARALAARQNRKLSYRIVFAPETLGAILYISRNLEALKKNVVAGFVVTCAGDERNYSYIQTPTGTTLADRVARHVLKHTAGRFSEYTFMSRGSDERQYCAPLVGLPVVSLMRSKHSEFPEYHTSLDDLSVITPSGLAGSFNLIMRCIDGLECNNRYIMTVPCEPQLGRRNLYPDLSTPGVVADLDKMLHILAYADGSRDLLEIADIIGADIISCGEACERFREAGLITEVQAAS